MKLRGVEKDMTKIDAALLKKLRNDIDEALKPIGEKFGVNMTGGNASYVRNGSNGTMKLEICAIGEDGEIFDRDKENFKQYASMYGFDLEDLGKTFVSPKGKMYRVTGLNPNATKMPMLCTEVLGKKRVFKFGAETLKSFLGKNK